MQIPHSTRASRLAVFLLASTSLMAVPAAAQQTPAGTTADDNVIIVTALKRAQDLQDVPLAITALGNEQLDQLQVNELKDIVKFLPSVSIQSAGPGFAQVYFRGVASGENANHSTSLPTVGTYLDEMPITTIQGALDIHAYDLARVEALAGPQGTLYGASSMAGTIRLITNQPDTSGNYGAVDIEGETVAHGGIGGTGEGFVNLALSPTIALRAVGWYRHDAGFIDNIAGSRTYPTSGITQNNAAYVKDDYNDVDTYGGRVALGIELNDSWTIRPTVMAQRTEANGTFAQERSSAVNGPLQTVQYNPEFSTDEWLQAALTIEGKLGDWDLTVATGHLWRHDVVAQDYSDYAYFYDALYSYGSYFYDNAGNLVSPNQYIEGSDRYRRLFGEIRIASPAENRLRLIAGLFGQRQTHQIEQHYIVDNISDDIQVPGTIDNIWLTRQTRTDRDLAAFGELSFDITERLTATGGIRVYYYKNSLIGFFGYNNPGFSSNPVYACQGPAVVDGSPCTDLDKTTSDTDYIHKLNLTYKITDDALVYATWSRGFRPGGINRRGSLPPYSPDKLDNYEIGWKTNFGPFRFNGAVYQEDWNNIQLSFLGANGLSEVRNAGIARIRGAELDLGYHANGFSLNLSGSYNDSKIRRPFCRIANAQFDCTAPGPQGQSNSELAPTGTQLPLTPKFKGTAITRYEFPVGSWDGHIQAAVTYTGRRRSDLRTLENALKGEFDAYATADFSIGVKNGRYRAELFATNLFDSGGVISSGVQCLETTCGDPDGISSTGGVFYDYVIKPRTIGLKFGVDF
ncbi:MAG: TonB-dependent receptor [Croceibacterium sp.]